MWTQQWSVTELKELDREAHKIVAENGGKHPSGSTAIPYMPRGKEGRCLRSIEEEYKVTKIKATVFTKHQEVRANRVDARIINHVSEQVITLEMSCPWVKNREKKEEEKTTKCC